ncbi:hypothetical protein INR49_014974 [Caranx melampygus]|nr:hypothetical protein INR49_014974 [Caranx melampygus]
MLFICRTGDGKEKLDQWLYEDAEWVRSHSSTDIRNADECKRASDQTILRCLSRAENSPDPNNG